MRLDHIAYRTKDRYKTAKFFEEAFGYKIGIEFQIEFDDDSKAECMAMVPPEVRAPDTDDWQFNAFCPAPYEPLKCELPEIFISDGHSGSIVGDWVEERGGVGGIHHIAYQTNDVEGVMNEWKRNGYAEFLSDEPLRCPGLEQVFTKPSELTGVIYELIRREGKGFCELNVKGLMESTKGV